MAIVICRASNFSRPHARAERDLLVLGEEVLRRAVQHHPADRPQREVLLGPRLRVIERVPVELRVIVVIHHLDVELPLRELAALDRLVEAPSCGSPARGPA